MWSTMLVMGVLSASGDAFGVRGRREASLWRNAKRVDFPENCTYPCTCPENQADCEECLECPRQVGEPCSQHKLCDSRRGIFCRYRHGDSEGICQESGGLPCLVYNKTYEHGETFSLDCRTQCTCQNGTYGCSSLCPQERISPKGTCKHPRLVEVPGQCCREWMCDSQTAEEPPSCQPIFSKWSTCSSDCGAGLSSRRSNLNVKCEPATETRICQTRRCDDFTPEVFHRNEHHVRRGHECKATHRISSPVTLRFGPCRSRKRYRPKFCGSCSIPGVSCEPLLSTTVRIEFFCQGPPLSDENNSELLPEYLEPGEDLWTSEMLKRDSHLKILTVSVQWILKCRCQRIPTIPTSSTGEIILHRVHRTAAP